MKNKILPVLFGLAVVFAANQASAYYSPSTGRWLSRDPNGEPGFETLRSASAAPGIRQTTCAACLPSSRLFKRDPIVGRFGSKRSLDEEKNVYAFVQNNPISLVDADGLAIPPAVAAALAVLVATEACAWPPYKAAFNKYPDSGDKFKHCWVSCRISKSCGGVTAEFAGLGKEFRDRAVAVYCDYYPNSEICQGGHGDFWDSIGDLQANQKCIGWESLVFGAPGGWFGAMCRRSCEDCCKAKVGYNTGKP